MLYDKRWDAKVETKTDPFTLESLIAWLEKRDPAEGYIYTCNGHCLLAQYFTAMGFKQIDMRPLNFYHSNGTSAIPGDFNDIALDRFARFGFQFPGRTFGAALERARSLAPQSIHEREGER